MTRTATGELAFRAADRAAVMLLSPTGGSRVLVRVADGRAGCSFELSVEGDKALDAFHHPYAYAAAAGYS